MEKPVSIVICKDCKGWIHVGDFSHFNLKEKRELANLVIQGHSVESWPFEKWKATDISFCNCK